MLRTVIVIVPGQKVRDLDEKMGTFEQIRSAKVREANQALFDTQAMVQLPPELRTGERR